MKSEDYKNQLADLENEIDLTREILNRLIETYKEQLISIISEWMESEIVNLLKEHYDFAQSLGKEKISEIKASLKTLQDKIPELLEVEFADYNRYPHYSEHITSIRNYDPLDSYLNHCFEKVSNHLGNFLSQFGLMKDELSTTIYWQKGKSGNYEYRGILKLPRIISHEEYSKAYQIYSTQINKLIELRKLIKNSEIEELWE